MLRFRVAPRWLLRNTEFVLDMYVFCETVVKFWVFVSSLEGLPRAQKQHIEIADSRGDLLRNSMKQFIKKARLRKHGLIRFCETFVKFEGFGCRFLVACSRPFFRKMSSKRETVVKFCFSEAEMSPERGTFYKFGVQTERRGATTERPESQI